MEIWETFTGIDIGTSTVAAVSDDLLMLKELAPKLSHEYNRKIKKVSKHIESVTPCFKSWEIQTGWNDRQK